MKGNQPKLLQRLELGAKGRKPSDQNVTRAKARNREETRALRAYPAKAWFKNTLWDGRIKTVLHIERTVHRYRPKDGLWTTSIEKAFYVSSADNLNAAQWNKIIRDHWRIENSCHYVRDGAFDEDASRIRKNPDIVARLRSFAFNILRANGSKNIKNDRWIANQNIAKIFKMNGV